MTLDFRKMHRRSRLALLPREGGWRAYAASLLLVALVTAAGFYMEQRMARTNLAMLYLLTVVIAALRLGRGPALAGAVISSIIFGVCFVPPSVSLPVNDIWYLITFITLLVVGVVISTLASQAREEARKARNHERQTAALYSLSRSLAAASRQEEILEAIARHIVETFHQPLVILLPEGDRLAVRFCSPGFVLTDADREAAQSLFRQDGVGRGQPRSSQSPRAAFLALETWRGVLGLLGVPAAVAPERLTAEERQLLEGFASQAASALERARLAEEARQAQLLQDSHKLQKALLSSISHDLRTPLASIGGALLTLLEDEAMLDSATRHDLLETAQGEAERLNRVVGNLLDMTRLEAGVLGPRLELTDVQDVVGTALDQLGSLARNREIRVALEANLPLLRMDPVLIAQALVNLLDNALKYSPADQPVDVRARLAGEAVEIQVEDRGIGIAPADLEKIFERFYRSPSARPVHGMGLGLSISKRFIEAHGGAISASRSADGGALLTFTLPVPGAGSSVAKEVGYDRRTASSRS